MDKNQNYKLIFANNFHNFNFLISLKKEISIHIFIEYFPNYLNIKKLIKTINLQDNKIQSNLNSSAYLFK